MLQLGAADTSAVFDAAKKPAADPLANVPPAAQLLLPAAVTLLVDRHRHPVVWWLFGMIPLTGVGARAIMQKRFL